VFVVREGKLVRVPVELGGGEGGDVEIKTGITAADDVVSPADATLKEGMRVEAGTGPSAA
jgi:membrane fusion protein (multidrug efflux system)